MEKLSRLLQFIDFAKGAKEITVAKSALDRDTFMALGIRGEAQSFTWAGIRFVIVPDYHIKGEE